MAEAGAVSWQFTRKGFISISDEFDADEIFLVAADAGADDVVFLDGVAEVYTDLDTLQDVRTALEDSGYKISEVSVIFDPTNPIGLEAQQTIQVMKLVEVLEDLDDVQNVYTALEISDEAMAILEVA
jgi:transcriptional/translational regulatory protein YebC/TACO1